jgi:hypothetical protein
MWCIDRPLEQVVLSAFRPGVAATEHGSSRQTRDPFNFLVTLVDCIRNRRSGTKELRSEQWSHSAGLATIQESRRLAGRSRTSLCCQAYRPGTWLRQNCGRRSHCMISRWGRGLCDAACPHHEHDSAQSLRRKRHRGLRSMPSLHCLLAITARLASQVSYRLYPIGCTRSNSR